jgi:NAD(P)-dependent dehydrogenase (short-subunit alcohol dehydrogenase family)
MESALSRPLAVVTGASSGIGRELAARFAESGYDLVVAAEDDRIGSAAGSFAEHGIQAVPVLADLATFDGVEQLYQAIGEEQGAGGGRPGPSGDREGGNAGKTDRAGQRW